MLFLKKHDKSSPINSTHYAMLYPQNDDCFAAIDSVTLLHPIYILLEKHSHICALEMVSSGNQHCANCIGTLLFPFTILLTI